MHTTVNKMLKFSKSLFLSKRKKFSSLIIKLSLIRTKIKIIKNKILSFIFGLTENLSSKTPSVKIDKPVKKKDIKFLKPGNNGFILIFIYINPSTNAFKTNNPPIAGTGLLCNFLFLSGKS
jgi:hypothetical protein